MKYELRSCFNRRIQIKIKTLALASLDIARRRYNNSDKRLVFNHVKRENHGFQKLQFVSERISDESGFDSCPKSLKP